MKTFNGLGGMFASIELQLRENDVKTKLLLVMAGLAFVECALASTTIKGASGTVLIAAPTAINGPTNQGVWFINPASSAFSLILPELASDQVFEGWIVDNCTGIKTSTGLFRASGGIDSNAAGIHSGPLSLNFPPVPGSDFITLGSDLADGSHLLVVTIEPYPDSDPNPSAEAVLRTMIPSGATVGTELTLQNVAK